MSAIFTILIYVADLLVIYVLSDSINFVFIAGCVIPAAMAVILLASFFGLRPKAIKKLRAAGRKNIISAIKAAAVPINTAGIVLKGNHPKRRISRRSKSRHDTGARKADDQSQNKRQNSLGSLSH